MMFLRRSDYCRTGKRKFALKRQIVGELELSTAAGPLAARLTDESLRVRYFAAAALGRTGNRSAVEPVLAMLADNADRDPIVRHGGIMALAGIGQRERASETAPIAASRHASASVRLATVVAMRRLRMLEVAGLLNDVDPLVVVEAARAIHDEPIEAALPELELRIGRSTRDDALLRRVLNANFRLGGAEQATAVAEFACSPDAPEAMRLESLQMLSDWGKPSPKDRVLNQWRPLAARPADAAVAAMKVALPRILAGSGRVPAEALKVAAKLGITEVGPRCTRCWPTRRNRLQRGPTA